MTKTYPQEAIRSQIVFWESGQIPGSQAESDALAWRAIIGDEAAQGKRRGLPYDDARSRAIGIFTGEAFKAWRASRTQP